jgi:ubiquinone/menaquinone biosynthesis C-methylase UbiE
MNLTLTHPDAGPAARTSMPDFDAIKARQQATWSSGDFGRIGVTLQIVGETLCEAVDVVSTDKVLDVAAGAGNASVAAARRFADVLSTDYVPALLDEGRRRAEADRLPMAFEVADAEQLPFSDRSFDVVLSTFGVMFAPNQERAAAELVRVVKPGGRIGLANWTPEGFIGQLFRVISRFVPPPAGLRSPMEWGAESRLSELFGSRTASIRTARRMFMFRYRSARHFVEYFRTFYGPTVKAFGALDPTRQQALHEAIIALVERFNVHHGAALVVPGEYLEVAITK